MRRSRSTTAFLGSPATSGGGSIRRGGSAGGILGLGATLAKQSGASRTSPILRGNWVSEVLLGEKLPKPPKDVPAAPGRRGLGQLTMRQITERRYERRPLLRLSRPDRSPRILAARPSTPSAAAVEKDAAGRAIDTGAKLVDGTEFAGLEGLRSYLVDTRREAFVRQFCRKLLGYALGRGVQLSDEPLLDAMHADLEANGYRGLASDRVDREEPPIPRDPRPGLSGNRDGGRVSLRRSGASLPTTCGSSSMAEEDLVQPFERRHSLQREVERRGARGRRCEIDHPNSRTGDLRRPPAAGRSRRRSDSGRPSRRARRPRGLRRIASGSGRCRSAAWISTSGMFHSG